MSTYCRITGKSRGLPKPNYFPLLPPISPADAKRLCRITGKSYGLPSHHYIPVLVGFLKDRSGAEKNRCHITAKADGQDAHHYVTGVEHTVLKDYKYVFPKWETSADLTRILEGKTSLDDEDKYVYTVGGEHKCNLVFPGRLEAAVRDGDVSDVMLAKTSDSVLFKLGRSGRSVEVDVEEISIANGTARLYDGEGPSEETLERRKKRKRAVTDKDWRRKIFEDKEQAADDEEELQQRRNDAAVEKNRSSKRMKMKLSAVKESGASSAAASTWRNVRVVSAGDAAKKLLPIGTGLTAFLSSVERPTNLDRLTASAAASSGSEAAVIGADRFTTKRLPKPINVIAADQSVDLTSSIPGIIQQPNLSPDYCKDHLTGFEIATVLAPFKPLLTSGFDDDVQHALNAMNENQTELKKMAVSEERFADVGSLPLPQEIARVVEQIRMASSKFVNGPDRMIVEKDGLKGLEVNLDGVGDTRFVPGEFIETSSSGFVFVPGGTIVASNGRVSFTPGFRVNSDGVTTKFIPGQVVVVARQDSVGGETSDEWVFVAGRTVLTRDGEKFVQGQEVATSDGVKFLPGQTVYTQDGRPAFIPGQMVEDVSGVAGDFKFVPGQIVTSADGPHFVAGIFSAAESRDPATAIFTPGRTVLNEQFDWEFVPGQLMKSADGKSTVFVPGIVSEKDRSFVPGLMADDGDGKRFVPGIVTNDENGELTFVPGMNVNVDERTSKFVEGLIIKTGAGNGDDDKFAFVAGRVSGKAAVAEDGTEEMILTFEPARELDQICLRDVAVDVFAADGNESLLRSNGRVMFGHMVQSSEGVEFFPGDEPVGLPAGKVVPGRLVRLDDDKEIQFIPGRMIANKFVPGQAVITDRGEQFIPGQVIETDEGPKFVPGQVLATKSGPKFVPGQTVETAEGRSRFVPGQIVNTKAGPTFIPGQVIHTEEEGSRFVPGQVVDTAEGPRFVPGKVVETGDHVTFIPGQIVQTAEGLKFVAPDLEDDPEGDGFHFTVQGYEVSPEELRMLQRNSISHALFHSFEAEPAINSTMLEQLASAGMAIGREVPIDVPVIDIKPLPITEAACVLGEKLNIDPNYSVKLSHIFSNMQQLLSTTLPLRECDDDNLRVLLNALTSTTDGNVLTALSQIMEEIISLEPERKLHTIDLLHAASGALLKKTLESDRGKLSTLHRLLISNSRGRAVADGSENETISALISILPEEEYAVCSAFKHLCQQNPEMVDNVLQNVAELLRNAGGDDSDAVVANGGGGGCDNRYEDDIVTETIHRAIIKTVMEASERTVREVLDKADSEEFKCLLLDAVGLAKALGMTDIANALVNVLSDAKCVEVLAKDNITLDVLKRLTIMRQLAKKRPHLGRALHELQLDPYSARKDPRLKELVRESAALMLVPEESAVVLKSSVDVPASLLFGDNSLAMEDFMVKSRRHGNTFLILKQGLQAVIPREAARSVLTGQVPYTVLDENGIHYFKPLHVFSALKLPQFATDRFSTYSSKQRQNYIDDEHSSDDSGITTKASSSALSYEDLRKSFENGFSITSGQGSGEEFIVIKDYFEDSEDDKAEFYVDKGDRVKVLSTDDDDPTLKSFSEEVNFYKVKPRLLLDNSTARYKITIKPPKKHGDARHRANGVCSSDSPSGHPDGLLVQVCDEPSRSGLIPMDYLKKAPASRTNTPDSLSHQKSKKQEAKFNREVVIGELIETEAEFAQDIQRVVDKYLTPLEQETRPAPRFVMDNKDIIFNNLRQISTFHNGIMVEGVKYFLKEPRTIGKTLLRLERDFDKHAQYCRNEPAAQELLIENEEVRDYFEDLSREIGDDKILSDHLKLPIQRINDYQLLLKELIKYSKILCEDTTDLERALELMLWIPTRCNDLKFVTNIEGFHGNIHKLGRLIRHNWFLVKDKTGGKGRERYCFLFKARLLICKVRRISEDRAVFVLKEIIKLPEVDFKNYPDKRTLVITHSDPNYGNYPFTFIAHEDTVKSDWLNEIAEHITESLALAEHVADDLKLQKEEEDLFEPLKGIELDITADIEEGLDPIETRLHKPLKHVPEPKRPPLEVPKKRVPIFTCVDPEPEPEPEMFSTVQIEEHCSIMSSTQEEMYIETQSTFQEITATESVTLIEEPEVEELIEIPGGKRKPKYIPGVSRPLFHSNIRGTTNERLRSDSKDIAFSWWKYTSEFPSYHEEFESLVTAGENAVFECEVEGVNTMTWLKDNRPLSDKLADRINIVSDNQNNIYRLEIRNVCESDSGTYTARAENPQGVSLSTAQLIVEKLTEEQKKARAKATTPVFTVQLKDAELLEGTHARFMVKVNGNPAPEVRFFKGDTLITEENENIIINKENAHKGFYELIIPDVKPEDAGEYRCEASNKYSDESCSCIVTVTNEKDVFAGLQDTIPVGGAPQFLWLKNGKPFYPEERFKVIFKDEEDSLALVFQNVKPDDAGLYTCIASTSHGKISCSAELTVQGTVKEVEKLPKLAKITTTTKLFEVNAGTTAVLEVTVSGDPLPTVKWKRHKEEITSGGRYKIIYDEENETASLVIKNVNLEDSDEYTVIADNEISADRQTVSLSVKAAPQIKRRLTDFVGLTGKQLKFTIEVEASPKPIVQWYKDGMVLKQSKRIKYVTDEASDTYTLIIDEAVMDDAGTYSVVASNEFSQISDVCRVTMKSPPQFVGSITKEIETLEGDYVSFSVMVEGDPLPTPKWKFNGKEIENDGTHVKMSEEGPVYTLLISEVKRTDAGLYSCEIFNQFGSNESEGSLIVKCLPLFTTPLSDIKVKEGDIDVELTVTMNSYPKSTVTWYRDDTDISTIIKDYKISEDGDNYTLKIKKATTKIAGIYKCRAQNEVGVNETSASVLVLTLPNFKKELINVDVKEGESLKLTVQCRGVPEPDVKWYKDGEELYSDSRIKITRDAKRVENYNLTITLVQSEDGGEYEVRATNEMGTAVTKSLVTVLANTSHKKRNEEETGKNKPTDIEQNGSDLEEHVTRQKAVVTNDEDNENIISKSTKTTIETTDYSHQNGDISSQMITTKNITHKVETAIIENNDAVNNAIFDHSSKARKNKHIHDDEEKSWWEEKDSNDSNSTKEIIVSIMHDINHDGKENGTKKPCKGSKWDVTESEITVTTLQTNDSNPDIVEMKKSHKSYTWDAEVDEEFKDTKSSKLAEDEQNFVSTKPPIKKKWTALSEKTAPISKDESSETIHNVNRRTSIQNVSSDNLKVKISSSRKETFSEENVSSTIYKEETHVKHTATIENDSPASPDGFAVFELKDSEFDAATASLRPSSFGIIEEPPENEHYIKINVSRGVSIVSVSEEENFSEDDYRVGGSGNKYEETFSYSGKRKCRLVSGFSEASEELNLELEDENAARGKTENDGKAAGKYADESVISIDIENNKKSRLTEIEEVEDDAVNELLKRVQRQRSILGEILQKEENKNSSSDGRGNSLSVERRLAAAADIEKPQNGPPTGSVDDKHRARLGSRFGSADEGEEQLGGAGGQRALRTDRNEISISIDRTSSVKSDAEEEDGSSKTDYDARKKCPTDGESKSNSDRRSSYADSRKLARATVNKREEAATPQTCSIKQQVEPQSDDINRKAVDDVEPLSSRRSSYADSSGRTPSYVDSVKPERKTRASVQLEEDLSDAKSSTNDNDRKAANDVESITNRRSSYANSVKPERTDNSRAPDNSVTESKDEERLSSISDVNRKTENDLERLFSRRSSYADSSRRSSYADSIKQKSSTTLPDDWTKKAHSKDGKPLPTNDANLIGSALSDAEPITNRRSSYADYLKPEQATDDEKPDYLHPVASIDGKQLSSDGVDRTPENHLERISSRRSSYADFVKRKPAKLSDDLTDEEHPKKDGKPLSIDDANLIGSALTDVEPITNRRSSLKPKRALGGDKTAQDLEPSAAALKDEESPSDGGPVESKHVTYDRPSSADSSKREDFELSSKDASRRTVNDAEGGIKQSSSVSCTVPKRELSHEDGTPKNSLKDATNRKRSSGENLLSDDREKSSQPEENEQLPVSSNGSVADDLRGKPKTAESVRETVDYESRDKPEQPNVLNNNAAVDGASSLRAEGSPKSAASIENVPEQRTDEKIIGESMKRKTRATDGNDFAAESTNEKPEFKESTGDSKCSRNSGTEKRTSLPDEESVAVKPDSTGNAVSPSANGELTDSKNLEPMNRTRSHDAENLSADSTGEREPEKKNNVRNRSKETNENDRKSEPVRQRPNEREADEERQQNLHDVKIGTSSLAEVDAGMGPKQRRVAGDEPLLKTKQPVPTATVANEIEGTKGLPGEDELSRTKEYPKIVSGLDNDLSTYESLSVTCDVVGSGVPTPTASWYHDGEELRESKRVHMIQDGNLYKLELLDLRSIDAGTYTIKLENSIGDISKSTQLNISNVENLRGPKLKVPLKNTVIDKNQKVVMSATYVADPVPDAIWTVNGKDVNAELSVDVKEIELDLKECQYTMIIPRAELNDTGTYKLKVKNKFETAECSASLTIVMKPEIESFQDIVVTPSTPCKFEVTVKAVPAATVTWSLNNKPLDLNNSNYKLDSEKIDDYNVRHTLKIDDAQLCDQGEYTLTAENNLGTTSASANLKLYVEAPSFVKLLEDCAVQDNDLLQMKVRINGVPKATVTWFKDNKEIVSNNHLRIETFDEGQVSSTLIIDSFTDDDVAEYKVIATNVAGQADSVAKLTMAQIEPSFSEPLKRISDVYEGDTLELVAKVAGSPIPSVQWFKDGELLKPDGEHIKSSTNRDGTIKLFIDDIKTADCGAYKAVATNAIGKSVANTAVVVNQKPKPPSFIKGLIDVTVIEGESIKFQIQISGFPEPKVKWLKDGHPLHACPALDFTSAPNSIYGLTIEKATLEDAGHYSIIISNKLGEATSSCNTVVTPSDREPFFISKLHPTKVVDGYPVKLEVNVGGFPLPQLSWNFNEKLLPIDGVNIKLVAGTDDGSQCLLIEKVSPTNAGMYKVIAENKLGKNFTEAPLTVTSRTNSEAANEKPAFLHGLRDTTVDESSILSISAPFMGNPIPDVEWYKDGCFLQPNERIHFTCDGYKVGLEIQDTNMGDSGFYSCVLKNPYGEDSSAAHIGIRKLYQAPIFTQRFKHMQQLPGNDCKFHARVTGVPFPSVIWHRNGLPITNSDKFQIKRDGDICCLTIFNVKPADDAQYSCIASNRDGTATCEAQLQVVDKIDNTPKQEAPVFMKRIGDCELYPGMTAKFTACATGYPEPQYEWFLDTIRLHPSDRYVMEKEPSGLVRLKILEASPDTDTGRYKLRAFNCNGEAFCEAQIIFDTGLDNKPKRPPVGELYKDYDRYRATGAPLPLPDKPIISRMTDRHLTLSWKPSLPFGSREPVTYLVEMEEQPDGEWFTARAGIRSCACDIHNLIPFRDYKFRVRVENTYGISDPSPYAITYREKLQPDPPKLRTHLSPGSTFHPDTSPCFPKDFDIERPPHDNYAQAPRFLRQEYETQYGVKGHNANLFWFVYGYPKPKMAFYFNDELIEMGGRYDSSYTRNGQATLFINKMLDRDVGIYEAVATNEYGIARQRVQLKIAEYPEFLRRPEETTVQLRKSCRLEARVIGVPYPEIKWYKDWQPLAPSSRIQIDQVEPDLCILRITDVIMKDEGLYSISARNIAGSISTSVALHVEEPDSPYSETRRSSLIKPKTKPFDDLYDLGDELGRGTQGAVYHVVERGTGKNFAAKVMHGTGDLKKLMSNELDIMNQLNHRNIIRPYDALITPRSFTIIQELAGGGELLDSLTRKPFITEHEVSTYIRQLLLALESMHEFNFAHLGLTPGDLLISHAGGDELKLADFGLSRKINSRKLEPLYFGIPEFVPPEAVNGEGVNLSADMWSVGIITHLLLTGVSLFKADNDAETLDRIKEGKFSVSTDMSQDARDFIIKLLMMNPNNRLDVKEALNHRWIKSSYTLKSDESSQKINTEPLRNYYNLYKNWYSNSSCETWYRRKPLESAYQHPSRMIYPPGMTFTPAPSPEPSQPKDEYHAGSWRDKLPSKHSVDTDIGVVKSESHYQYGPDTYLLQLRDVDFPVRLREYMKVAKVTHENIDWRAPIIRERRKFMDVMDEEIDDEQKARLNQYGNAADIYTLRRLKQEVGTRPVAHLEAEAILGSRIDGQAPFFREKPQFMSVEIDKPTDLVCFAVGSPKPVVQWFKNDLVVTEGQRIKYLQDNDGRSVLRLDPVSEFDLGIYKVVARNKFGQTVARTRLVLASEPCAPSAPKITAYSDTEVLLKWDYPKDDGNSPVLCYCLQMKEDVYGEWTTIADNIDHEFWLVRDLRPNIKYQFRLSVMNRIGWSPEGLPSEFVKTKLPGINKVEISENMKTKQAVSEQGREIIGEEPRRYFDYSREYKPIQWLDEPDEGKLKYISELSRGQFSTVVKALDTESGSLVAAKLLETKGELMKKVNNEFEILRVLCHERIVYLIEGFKCKYSAVAVLIMEKLQGADILTYLTSRPNYTEQMIATIINQVLDGLQYLHWRGYCHLNLQPNNVIMASAHNLQIKLIDFGCARHVNKLGTIVHTDGPLEYTAPEILCEEPAYPNSDIWSVGVLTYILLSSVSPFRGNSDLETRQNITFVRYRFEHLYKNLSQEATRFIMLLFKRTPSKRPSAEECQEHRWLLPTEYMIKKREKNTFGSNRLKCFSDDYHSKISQNINASKEILSVTGSNLRRSNSIVEELGVF